ncbi:MAG: ester cyclase [Anaerolineales bacterium]
MSIARNIEVLNQMVAALVSHDLEAQDKYWKKDMIWHGPPSFGDVYGLEAFKYEVVQAYYTAFPDYDGAIDIQVAQGDWIAGTGYVTGTHLGEWLGIPPTGLPVKMRYSDFWRFEDGLLAENWVMTDDLDVMRQLGVDLLARRNKA